MKIEGVDASEPPEKRPRRENMSEKQDSEAGVDNALLEWPGTPLSECVKKRHTSLTNNPGLMLAIYNYRHQMPYHVGR